MNQRDDHWPRLCRECGNDRATEFDQTHLSCMSRAELEGYIKFWDASMNEEKDRVRESLGDEIARRKAAYALWIASRRLNAGKSELHKRFSTNQPA